MFSYEQYPSVYFCTYRFVSLFVPAPLFFLHKLPYEDPSSLWCSSTTAMIPLKVSSLARCTFISFALIFRWLACSGWGLGASSTPRIHLARANFRRVAHGVWIAVYIVLTRVRTYTHASKDRSKVVVIYYKWKNKTMPNTSGRARVCVIYRW